jgi:hypothetical protein
MPRPALPPLVAAPPVAPGRCDLCGEACVETETETVVVVCNQNACVDAKGATYHRECLETHIEKTGHVRMTKGGAGDIRQIQRMDLTGARSAARASVRPKPRTALYRCALCADARARRLARLPLHPQSARQHGRALLRARARQGQPADCPQEAAQGLAARGAAARQACQGPRAAGGRAP